MKISLDEEQIEKLFNRLSFDSMKVNEYAKRSKHIRMMKRLSVFVDNKEFIRKGKSGQWEEDMDPVILERFKSWETERKRALGLCDDVVDELCE